MDLKSLIADHYDKITALLILIVGLLGIALKSYFTEKGRLRAQISENKKLVEQTEQIKSNFNRELEELKKDHQLEISKRKYQYESKKEQYLKFFKLLDEFSSDNNVKTQEKFMPMIEEFNRNFLNAKSTNNRKNENNATTVFSKKIQKLTMEANQDLIRIKQETNTIRLIASNDVIEKLDLLTLAYEKSMDKSNKMLNELPSLMILNDQDAIKNHQYEIEISALVINNVKNEIIELMRLELNKI